MSETQAAQPAQPAPVVQPAPPVPLRANRDFSLVWTAQTISMIGAELTVFALPLVAILLLGADALEVGYLVAAARAPYLVFGLLAGVWVDRWRRRRTMIVCGAARAALLVTVPIAWYLDLLTLAQLVLVTFAIGTMSMLFEIAYQTYLPSLVGRPNLIAANSRVEASRSVAGVLGPVAGGPLVAKLGAVTALLADAAAYVVATVLLMLVRDKEEQPVHPPKQTWRDVREGWNALFGDARLRLIAIAGGLNNFAIAVLFVVYSLYLLETLKVSVVMLGVVVGIGTVGAIAASALASKLSKLWGIGPALIVSSVIKAAGVALLAGAGGGQIATIVLLIAGFAAMFFGLQVFNINVVSLRQMITPNAVMGRVNATNKFVVWVPFVIGSLLGGVLGEYSLRLTVIFAAIALVASLLPLCANVLRSLHTVEPPEAKA